MTSHKNIKLFNSELDVGQKIFKSVYHIVVPVIVPLAVLLLAISFFNPMEGVDRYKTTRAVAIVLCVVLVALIVVNQILNNNQKYTHYENYITKKIRLSLWIPLLIMGIIVVLPFYIMLVTSIKTSAEANSFTFTWWPQEGLTFESYKNVVEQLDGIGIKIFRTFGNTLFYSTLPVLISVLVSAISAYAFAKLYFPGRNTLFMVLLFTMMMPNSMSGSTSYMMFGTIGWLDFEAFSLPMTIPGLLGSVGTMFFLRNYFQGIPDSLCEAAKLDGCGKLKTFFRIMLPLGMPALIVQFIMGFIGHYNNFSAALVYLKYPEQFTIARAIDFFDGQNSATDKTLIAAASTISLLPTLLLYVIFQKQILNGIQMSAGLKG